MVQQLRQAPRISGNFLPPKCRRGVDLKVLLGLHADAQALIG